MAVTSSTGYLGSVNDGDWAMYAGVEFGGGDYARTPRTLELTASSASDGGTIEVRLDAPDGPLVAEVEVDGTGSWTEYATTSVDVADVSGQHDVFLLFSGGAGELMRLESLRFTADVTTAAADDAAPGAPSLAPVYPNPFGERPTTISFTLPTAGHATLRVFNVLGQEVATLVDGARAAGRHDVTFGGLGLSSGVYVARLEVGEHVAQRRMTLVR